MQIQEVLTRLRNVSKVGDRKWKACCPAHDDNNPSLSVALADSGKVLLKCWSQNCSFEAIMKAMGVDRTDRDERTILATYDYRDHAGKLLYQVVRFVPKTFRQRCPDPAYPGGWRWSLKDVDRVLYRLPELLATPLETPVWIVEGEADADSLAKLGFVATTNSGGAGKWSRHYNHCFRGRNVVICPDTDEPGQKHGENVARGLKAIAKSITMVSVAPCKDVGEWLSKWDDKTAALEMKLAATAPWVAPMPLVRQEYLSMAGQLRRYADRLVEAAGDK